MRIASDSEHKTLEIGKRIAGLMPGGGIVCLFGDLGSGKTVLAKGFAKGLGIKPKEITSPTFVLIHEHLNSRLPLYHFDLYRINSIEEIANLGYEEYLFGSGLSIIEWADRLGPLIPDEYLKIELAVSGKNKRLLKISASGSRYKKLLKKINENIRH